MATKVKPEARRSNAGGISNGVLIVTSPSDVETVVPMSDVAADGEWMGSIEATEVGDWRMEAMVTGVNNEGVM
jgi:hypothetical protein